MGSCKKRILLTQHPSESAFEPGGGRPPRTRGSAAVRMFSPFALQHKHHHTLYSRKQPSKML